MESRNDKLITAAKDGDIEALKLCLKNGADINYQDGGQTALMRAAEEGHLEICRLLIDRGCKIDITTGGGVTALMVAAGRGHLEICRLLIDRGCKIDITDTGLGLTALILAASGGRLEICRLLIGRGCKIDITDIHGETALHYAAREGYLQITRCLVEQGGASPLITTRQGETPYDLAAAEQRRQYKEVMEYLQTVMSEKSSGVTAEQEIKGNMVPTEIKLMADKRSIDLYLKLLESGSEKKRDIRLVVVGKQGAGKTSLIRRLFGEDITDVTSTNGIEIHKIKCKAMSDDGIWNKLDEKYEVTETLGRLLKEYEEQLQDKGTKEKPVESHMAIKDKRPAIFYDESMESETETRQPTILKPPEAAEPHSEPPVTPQQSNKFSDQAAKDFETMLSAKSKVDVHDKEEYATFLLWDFAGDEEFYHTHQTFLSQDAMYLVVTKLNEADDPNAQALFRLWIDSIHCYSRLEEGNILSDDKTMTSGDLDPPVVIVGTWKDAVTSKTNTVEEACRKNLLQYTEKLADDEREHIRLAYFISNKEDECSVFQQIRQTILNLARGMRTWNKEYPLKFIQLEQRLQEQKKELPIVSYQEMKNISFDTPKPLTEDELILFLEFHHELRSLVYFKDLSEYIILDTQWLSDAFRCIVTAKKFQINFRNQKKWNDFFQRGELNNAVLEDIFKNETQILYEHKDFILKVMEKFDIIIHPNKSEAVGEKPCYYVPCMIKQECKCDIYEMFKVPEDTRHRSTWLCFKFRFLPPHLMNHLIASLSRKYAVAEVVDSRKQKRQIALFKGTAVFELQHETTKLRKLLVITCANVIQIQVWEFGEDIKSGLYKYIDDFVTEELNTIMHTRFKMSNVKFEKTWECGLTEPKCVTGSNKFLEETITEYQCDTCQIKHMFIDEWSDQHKKALTKLDIYKKEPGQKGLVLIVNFMFRGDKRRIGSNTDVENLTKFFSKLQYQIECRYDMTKKELQDYFQEIKSEYLTEKSEDYHSFICVIMSHGNEKGLITKDKIITVDEIKKRFTGFTDKPKLFLIQACRGNALQEMADGSDSPNSMQDEILERRSCVQSRNPESEEQLYTDSEDRPKLPKDADIIVAYATTSGYASIRNPTYGSYLISAFLDVANENYKQLDVEEILRKARLEVTVNTRYKPKSKELAGTRQMIIVESTSRKRFFL